MKTKKLFVMLILLCILPVLAYCFEEDQKRIGNVDVPDGMDVIKEGDVNVMVPKGGELRKQSSFLVKEDADEYASRKFIAMEEYFVELKKEIEAQREEISYLRQALEKMREGKDKPQSPKQ